MYASSDNGLDGRVETALRNSTVPRCIVISSAALSMVSSRSLTNGEVPSIAVSFQGRNIAYAGLLEVMGLSTVQPNEVIYF
mgnify:CR=1 FL=1